MKDQSQTVTAIGRAGRRAVYHLLRAAVESLKAVEAVIEEISGIGEAEDDGDESRRRERIEVE